MCQREGKVCKLWVADCGGSLRTRKTIEISVRERFPPRINYQFNKCYLYFICDGVCPSMNTKLTSIRPYVLPFCCSIFLFFFYHITVNKDEHITQILIKIEVKWRDNQDFFYLILEMSSVSPTSEKWVTLPIMPTKMGSLQRNKWVFLIITIFTHAKCMSQWTDAVTYVKTYRTVNTVYIVYKSVVTHRQSLTHTSDYFSSVIGALSTASMHLT